MDGLGHEPGLGCGWFRLWISLWFSPWIFSGFELRVSRFRMWGFGFGSLGPGVGTFDFGGVMGSGLCLSPCV